MTHVKEAIRRVSVIALAAIAVVACSGGGEDGGDGTKSSSAVSGQAVAGKPYDPAAHPASITGRIGFAGQPPSPRAIRMSADPYCEDANPGGAERASFRVATDGGLAETFVYISGGLEAHGFSPPAGTVVLDQQRCGYVPLVTGVRAGQEIEIRNSDATLHNVHAMPERSKSFNLGMPRQGMTARRKFAEPEVLVRFKCDVHPWMEAYVGVVAHPLFAITGEDGRYRIGNVPRGTYTIEAVHYRLGRQTTTVEVGGDGEVTADFTFSKQ